MEANRCVAGCSGFFSKMRPRGKTTRRHIRGTHLFEPRHVGITLCPIAFPPFRVGAVHEGAGVVGSEPDRLVVVRNRAVKLAVMMAAHARFIERTMAFPFDGPSQYAYSEAEAEDVKRICQDEA